MNKTVPVKSIPVIKSFDLSEQVKQLSSFLFPSIEFEEFKSYGGYECVKDIMDRTNIKNAESYISLFHKSNLFSNEKYTKETQKGTDCATDSISKKVIEFKSSTKCRLTQFNGITDNKGKHCRA